MKIGMLTLNLYNRQKTTNNYSFSGKKQQNLPQLTHEQSMQESIAKSKSGYQVIQSILSQISISFAGI